MQAHGHTHKHQRCNDYVFLNASGLDNNEKKREDWSTLQTFAEEKLKCSSNSSIQKGGSHVAQ